MILAAYKSPWEPLYRDYVTLRLAWVVNVVPGGVRSPGFFLCLLMNSFQPNVSLERKISEYKAACVQNEDTQGLAAIDEMVAQWGKPLARLAEALNYLQPESDIFEDCYHCALKICLGGWSIWYQPAAWMSKDGLTPELPPDQSFDLSLYQLLQRQAAITRSDAWMYPDADQPASLPPDLWIADPATRQKRSFRLFRGQRKAAHIWPIKATLDRWSDNERHEAASKVAKLAAGLEQQYGIGYDSACSVIQHYGSELKASTHLMDVTIDPLVALWFASSPDTPKEGEHDDRIGVIMQWSLDEYVNLGANRSEALGNLRILTPGSVPRICRQRGIFVAAPNPLFINQTFPFCLKFRQRDGLKFEDAARKITEDYLLKQPSPWFSKLQSAYKWPEPTSEQVKRVFGARLSDVEECLIYLKSNHAAYWKDAQAKSIEKLVLFHLCITQTMGCPELAKSLRLLNETTMRLLTDAAFTESEIPHHYHSQVAFGEFEPLIFKCWNQFNTQAVNS